MTRVATTIACVILCTFLPFLPGRYDSLAAPLSVMAQIIGRVGLLLVPIGALWLAYEYRRSTWRDNGAIGAFASASPALGVGAVTLGTYVVWRITRQLKTATDLTTDRLSPTPVYLTVVPVIVAILQLSLADRATEFSRNRAIRNAAPLIADIERYRATRGHYPVSLLSVWEDHDEPRHGSSSADAGGAGAETRVLCRSRRGASALEVLLVRLTTRATSLARVERRGGLGA